MAERAPWWRAFLGKRKSGGTKDATPAHSLGEDFDPFAAKPEKPKDPASASKMPSGPSRSHPGQPETGKGTSLLSDETFDDSQLESVFNEQSCRRNMRVSRSGRFKEKKRVRSSLQIEEKETTNKATSGKEEVR